VRGLAATVGCWLRAGAPAVADNSQHRKTCGAANGRRFCRSLNVRVRSAAVMSRGHEELKKLTDFRGTRLSIEGRSKTSSIQSRSACAGFANQHPRLHSIMYVQNQSFCFECHLTRVLHTGASELAARDPIPKFLNPSMEVVYESVCKRTGKPRQRIARLGRVGCGPDERPGGRLGGAGRRDSEPDWRLGSHVTERCSSGHCAVCGGRLAGGSSGLEPSDAIAHSSA
jgi:hypothetical protein